MAGKREHIGFQLREERPNDKKIMEILNNLPKHTSKCAYIRDAILFYYEKKNKALQTDEKLDLILEKLSRMSDGEYVPVNREVSEETEEVQEAFAPEDVEEVKEEPANKKPKKASAPVQEEPEEKEGHLSLNADASIEDEDIEDALGDFLD